jgi:hypothetical protein
VKEGYLVAEQGAPTCADDRQVGIIGIKVVKGVRIILNGGGVEYQDTELHIVAHRNMIESKLIMRGDKLIRFSDQYASCTIM